MTSFDFTKSGTTPVGTTVSSLIARNFPYKMKNLSNIFRISLGFCLVFKSISENRFDLMSFCIFSIRISGAFSKKF